MVTHLPNGGPGTVVLPDPSRFDRITAAVVNGSTANSGFSAGDWVWTQDDAAVPVTVTERAGVTPEELAEAEADAAEEDCDAPPVTPTPTPTPTATPGPQGPPPTPTVLTPTLKLGFGTLPRIARVARTGKLPFRATVNQAGRLTATATVDKATAKRLRLGRKRKVASGAKTATKSGRVTVTLKLTKKARKGLKRQQRTLRVKVRVAFRPSGPGRSIARNISLLLRPALN